MSFWQSDLLPETIEKLASGVTVLELLGGTRLGLDITRTGNDLVFAWESQAGKLYHLRSETDPSNGDPKDWPIYDGHGDIAATPDTNTLTISLPADPVRFFVIEEFPAPPVTVFSDDFESGQGAWTTGSEEDDGSEWELGTPSSVGPTTTNSGVNCFGTKLDANYNELADVWLRSPGIDLTSASGATLTYAEFTDIEVTFDFGTINVLDAADDSFIVEVATGIDGTTTEWATARYPLPAEALGKVIKVEFRFTSDNFNTTPQAGWYIDDVTITTPAP